MARFGIAKGFPITVEGTLNQSIFELHSLFVLCFTLSSTWVGYPVRSGPVKVDPTFVPTSTVVISFLVINVNVTTSREHSSSFSKNLPRTDKGSDTTLS